MKNFEMRRLSWIAQVGCQSNVKCPRKTDTEEKAMEMEAEIGVKWPQAKEAKQCPEPPETGKSNERIFP